MIIKPRNELILIEVADKDAPVTTAAGITIPPKQWAKPSSRAVVKALGSGLKSTDLSVGDTVLINPYAVIDTENKLEKLILDRDIIASWQE